MAGGRHARQKEPRSGSGAVFAVTLAAAAVAATAVFVDDLRFVRAAVVALAVLVVVPFALLMSRTKAAEAALQNLLDERDERDDRSDADTAQLRDLRVELTRMQEMNTELAAELARLREQVVGVVPPLPVEPDPVYPSLHLPLVRAAFSEDLAPVVTFEPAKVPPEVPPTVVADGGSDPLQGRRVLDLTASEIHALRKASGA